MKNSSTIHSTAERFAFVITTFCSRGMEAKCQVLRKFCHGTKARCQRYLQKSAYRQTESQNQVNWYGAKLLIKFPGLKYGGWLLQHYGQQADAMVGCWDQTFVLAFVGPLDTSVTWQPVYAVYFMSVGELGLPLGLPMLCAYVDMGFVHVM